MFPNDMNTNFGIPIAKNLMLLIPMIGKFGLTSTELVTVRADAFRLLYIVFLSKGNQYFDASTPAIDDAMKRSIGELIYALEICPRTLFLSSFLFLFLSYHPYLTSSSLSYPPLSLLSFLFN